jgi:putative transposase
MSKETSPATYKGFRFPIEIINYCVWLYSRFSLSFRDVELIVAERGITVSHETIRQWYQSFGKEYAQKLRQKRGQPGDKWHIMKSSSKSMARRITSGELSIKMA